MFLSDKRDKINEVLMFLIVLVGWLSLSFVGAVVVVVVVVIGLLRSQVAPGLDLENFDEAPF